MKLIRPRPFNIVNAEIAAAAAIAYSKLNLTGAILAADIAAAAGIPLTKLEAAVCSEAEAAALVTKEIFQPALNNTDMGTYGVLIDGAGDEGSAALLIPQDFTAITSIEVIVSPKVTGASMHFDITTAWGAYIGGEPHNVHTETADARNFGATIMNNALAHSISDLVDVSPLVAGDILAVLLQYDATAVASNFNFRGIRLKYT